MRFYRPRIDRLENRQLMASDLGFEFEDTNHVNPSAGDLAFALASPVGLQTASATMDAAEPALSNPMIDYISDSVVVRAGSMTVIGSRLNSELLVINGSESASPKLTYRLPLDGLTIQELKVDGSRAMIVGLTSDNHTQVVAIDLTAGKIVNRVQFPPGQFSFSHMSGNDAWVVLSLSTNPIVSPSGVISYPNDSRLIHLHWGESGLVEQSSLKVNEGYWTIAQGRLMMATYNPPSDLVHSTTLHLYDIGDGRLSEISSLELKSSYAKSLFISADGQHASFIRGVGDPSVEWKSSIDLLDLSNGSIRIAQSVAIDDFVDVYQHDADAALLGGHEKHQLMMIDLGVSVSSQLRWRTWDVPLSYNLLQAPIQLSNGRIGVSAYVYEEPCFPTKIEPPREGPADGTYLLILDPQSSQLKTLSIEKISGKFYSLDPGTNRIGIWGWSRMDTELPTFTFGTISDDLKFVKQGAVSSVDTRTDQPLIFSDRLLTTATDRVAIYDLKHPDEALLAEYVPQSPPPLKELSLVIPVSKWGANLDLFSSYIETGRNVARLHLVSLEGAPADVKVSDPLTIILPSYEDSGREPIDFDYIVSDGITQARGHIHVMYTDDSVINPLNTSSDQLPVEAPVHVTASAGRIESQLVLRHNTDMPLDVNQDSFVSPIDILLVIEAFNDVNLISFDNALDTSGDGTLAPLDALLIVDFLNLNRQPLAVSAVSAVTIEADETYDEALIAALKEHLARNFAQTNFPELQLLVGFAPQENTPTDYPGDANFSYEETVNQSIQSLVPPASAILSQPGLIEYNLGSSRLARYEDPYVINANTMDAVVLIKVGRPRVEDDGSMKVEIVSNFGTPLGSSGYEYQLRRTEGKWEVLTGGMIWIS